MAVAPSSIANLKPIQPGEVRNPHGRAKGEIYVSEAVRMLLRGAEPPENAPPVWSVARNVVRCLQEERLDSRLLNIVLDRLEGKVPDKLELSAQAGVVLLPSERLEAAEWSKLAKATLRAHSIPAEVVEERPALEGARGPEGCKP